MKKKLINKLAAGALVFASILPLAGNIPAYAETETKTGWVYEKEGKQWYYYDEDGQMLKNTTITINGEQYNFGSDGAWIETEQQEQHRWRRFSPHHLRRRRNRPTCTRAPQTMPPSARQALPFSSLISSSTSLPFTSRLRSAIT